MKECFQCRPDSVPFRWVRAGCYTVSVCGVFLALLLLGARGAEAQSDLRDLFNRLTQLETAVQSLERQQGRTVEPQRGGGAPSQPSLGAAGIEVRLSQLEDILRNLTGRVEQVEYSLRQMQAQVARLSSDFDFRVSRVEEKVPAVQQPAPSQPAPLPLAAAPAPEPTTRNLPSPFTPPPVELPPQVNTPSQAPQASAVQPPPPPGLRPATPQGSPEDQYNFAYGLVRTDLDKAEQAFKQFIERNRTHRLAENARYWLAETYYGRRKFDEAATAFAEAYQAAPTGEKAPDSLLKLGLTLGQLNRRADACGTFGALISKFPNLAATVREVAQRERAKLNCGPT